MPASVFFDTSVVVYATTKEDPRSEVARSLLFAGGIINVQVLNEFVNVARGKRKLDWDEIESYLGLIRRLCETPLPLTVHHHEEALKIAKRYGYRIYDSLLIAAATQAGCTTLYSEDMQDGQQIGPLTIRNPFPEQ